MVPLASEGLLAVRALALLLNKLFHLALGDYLLDTGQHLFRFLQPEPKCFWREVISLKAGDFLDAERICLLV
jgi:hypothetical protein